MEENEKKEVEVVEEKPKRKKEKGESIFKKIINFVLWIVILAWIGICLVDFYKTSNREEPMFCIKKETVKYNDGTVDVCTGLGYKIFNYKRKSFDGIEFGPFWSKDRSAEANK